MKRLLLAASLSLFLALPAQAETKADAAAAAPPATAEKQAPEADVAEKTAADTAATDAAAPAAATKTAPAGTTPSYLRKTKAAPDAEKTPVGGKQEQPLGRVIIALALVAVLGGIAVYAKRRRGGAPMLKDKVRLHTIGSIQLGAKSQVALVSVGREAILVGVSESGISCLRTYPEEELGQLTVGALGPLATPAPPEDPEVAFNDLLVRASKVAPSAAKPMPQPAKANQPPPDQFTPSGFVDEYASQPRIEDELPPHLKEILAETERTETRVPSNVKPLRPNQPRAQFGEPEGQAAELMRRFSELSQ